MTTNPYDELGDLRLTLDPSEALGDYIELLDEIGDWLWKVRDFLPAYEQNQARELAHRIQRLITGDEP